MSFSGIGLHTGNITTAHFKPAAAHEGIVFFRDDLPGAPAIPATIDHVVDVVRGTTIAQGKARVHTVEHIMAALTCFPIDNVHIHLNANEPPVADGSALPYVEIIEKAGTVELDAKKIMVPLTEPVTYRSGETIIEAIPHPSNGLTISFSVIYTHPMISRQDATFDITPAVFKKEIAPARTFCFDYEIEALKKNGLAKGGSLDNAVVIGIDQVHCRGNLRFPDEFVRHKILDFIGDFSLQQPAVSALIRVIRGGHGHNINFTRKIHEVLKDFKEPHPKKEEAAVENTPVHAPSGSAHKQVSTGLEGKLLSIQEIQNIIPHRFPFLMIDRVKVIEDMKKALGYKYVTGNEHFFQGHFPGRPIMPGVLIIEAMAQTSCILFLSRPELSHKLAFFMGMNNIKFRKPVEPGSVLELHVEVLRAREKGGKIRGEAFVGKDRVAEAEFMFVLVDKK